ncbi:MAG: type 4a pilus biogenesis protein PilO [Candidatus Methylomirabilales bacterium]
MNLSKREMVILGGLVAAAVAMYLFLLGPTATERARLAAESARLSRETQKITEALKAIPRGKEGLEEARARLEKIRARLLPPGGLSTLFGEISRPSKRLGVRIASFTPKGPDPAQHGQVSADLIVEGKYLELGKYLEEMFEGQILLSISDLKLQAAKSGPPNLEMRVVLKTWMRQEASQ